MSSTVDDMPGDVDDIVDSLGDGTIVSDHPAATSRPLPLWDRMVKRAVRRPVQWIEAPWTNERLVRYLTALIIVGAATITAIKNVHPSLIFTSSTATGGDMGAQVMAPAFLRDHLLPNFRLNGWSNYWYAGMPFYRFYMVIPGLMVVLLDLILPYGVAFKIVAVIGIVTLPFCCWCFGRLADLRYPTPELLALAGLLFLYDDNFSILGGNQKSTMAGEFSFSIALSLAVLGLGLFARGLRTGKYRSWTAILIALSALSHGIVLMFVFGAAVLLWLVWMDRTRLVYGASVIGGAIALSAFWVLPFLWNHEYMTDMKYQPEPYVIYDSFWNMFSPGSPRVEAFITVFALFGLVASIAKRHLTGAWMGFTVLLLVVGTWLGRESLPLIGLLWNPRILPFYYLMRLMLMMVGIVEFGYLVLGHIGWLRRLRDGQLIAGAVIAAAVGLGGTATLITMFKQEIVIGRMSITSFEDGRFTWFGAFPMSTATDRTKGPGWARYNFEGYEGYGYEGGVDEFDRPVKAYYGEYYDVVTTMEGLGATNGCGRAIWENNGENGKYGTTMALMLLPHWTDGCIASMEGLYFEASGTTPYHFLTAAAISKSSSNPVRELRYVNNDAAVGVPHMQTLGVKYLMVFTEEARAEAAAQPELTLVATAGPWEIYEVAGSELVEALQYQPVVVADRPGDPRENNLELGTSWFQNRDEWAAMPADDGPAAWQRITVSDDPARDDGMEVLDEGRKVDVVVPDQQIEQVALPAVQISNVELGDEDLSFTVDQIGVPVLVKMSYFPNWDVDGAEGPYRIAPNLMVVIPTQSDVRLHYGRTVLDYLSMLITLGGVGLLVWFRRRGDVVHATANPVLGDERYGTTSFGFGPELFTSDEPPRGDDPWFHYATYGDPLPVMSDGDDPMDPQGVDVARGDVDTGDGDSGDADESARHADPPR